MQATGLFRLIQVSGCLSGKQIADILIVHTDLSIASTTASRPALQRSGIERGYYDGALCVFEETAVGDCNRRSLLAARAEYG